MAVRRGMHTAVMIGVAIATLIAVTVTPVQGQVAENKTFQLTVSEVPAGDANATLTVTITNTSANQSLGSANVTVPSPLVVGAVDGPGGPTVMISASDPQTIELRSLDLAPGVPQGESFTFDVTVDVQQCTDGASEEFLATAKQSNTYLGTGNDFYWTNPGVTAPVAGTCALQFVDEPGDAQRTDAITSENYDPQGEPITVRILDAADDPMVATHSTATVTLVALNLDVDDDPIEPGGTFSAMADDGIATFTPGPTLDMSAFEYRLRASADFDGDEAVDASTDSAFFDIVDAAVFCPANVDERCEASASRRGQRIAASFGRGPTELLLLVSLDAADAPPLDCEGISDPGEVLTAQFFTVGDDDDPDATLRDGEIAYDIPNASRPLNQYEICWGAPYRFPTDGGGESTRVDLTGDDITKPDGSPVTELFVGILPDCKNNAPVAPCVLSRTLNKTTMVATVTMATDSRDPWARH